MTINLPRIAYLSNDEAEFYRRLDHLMDIAARSLSIKRTIITKLLNEGLYPYTKKYLGTFDNHFSTNRVWIGMNEAGLNAKWLRADMTHEKTQEFAKNVLNHMRERLSDYQEEYGDLYNLEATPAESTTYRLAKHDRINSRISSQRRKTVERLIYRIVPTSRLDTPEDIFEALDIQDEMQDTVYLGTVFHAFLGEKLPNWNQRRRLCARFPKITNCRIIPYHRHILSVGNTAI